MIDRQRIDGELREQFSVLGSTGNVRSPILSQVPIILLFWVGLHCHH